MENEASNSSKNKNKQMHPRMLRIIGGYVALQIPLLQIIILINQNSKDYNFVIYSRRNFHLFSKNKILQALNLAPEPSIAVSFLMTSC